ncbi:hypothetical protein ABIE38_001387 [Dietzia sp. 2505]|uniref:Mu transposase C-terminal domain-containing protein n=1 Tax=Dietzia sp. 2505 TaxID=3156457 RepID=UPI0033918775
MSERNWFGLSSEFTYGALRVSVHSINTDASPPIAILIDETGERHEVPLYEAIRLFNEEAVHNGPALDDSKSHLADSLEGLTQKQQKTACERAGHVREILYGDPSGMISADSDALFDPARSPLMTRIALKAEQLAGARGYSRSSLHRMVSTYEVHGTRGLAPHSRNASEPARPTDGVDDEVLDQIYKTLNEIARNRSTMTLKACLVRVRTDLGKAGLDVSDLTHHRIKSIVEQIHQQLKLRHTARSRRSLQSRSTRGRRRPPPSYPGEQIEIDSTQLNVMVESPSGGKPLRPWVIVAICILTRVVFMRITPQPPTSRDVRMLLWDIYGPTVTEHGPEDGALPLGVPESVTVSGHPFRMNIGTVVMDHGKEFENTSVVELLGRWGCDIAYARTRTGSDKPYVESMNRTLDLFQQDLEGYVGQGPEHRGESIDGALSFRALDAILKAWLMSVYMHRPHSGLPARSGDGKSYFSPAQAYALAIRRGAVLDCPLTADDIYTVLDSARVTVSSDGVRCRGLRYDGPALSSIKSGKVSPQMSLSRRKTVRFDPNDRSRVFFRDDEGRWHVLHAIDRNGSTFPPFSDSIASEIAAMDARKLPSDEADVRNRTAFVEVIDKLARTHSHNLDVDRMRILDTVPDPVGVPSVLDDEDEADDVVDPLVLRLDDCVNYPIEEGDLW